MADKLAAQLANLRIASPPLTHSKSLTLKVVLYDAGSKVSDIYRVGMNPRDMTDTGLVAGSRVFLQESLLVSVWPNATVQSRRIQVSSYIGDCLNLDKDMDLYISPLLTHLPHPEVLMIDGVADTDIATRVVLDGVRTLPAVQVGCTYQIPLGMNMGPICCRVISSVPSAEYLDAPTWKTRILLSKDAKVESEDIVIGGLQVEIEQIENVIRWSLGQDGPIKTRPPKGILLFGPPGTGKSLIATSICKKFNFSSFVINGAEIFGTFYGESEMKLRGIFEQANQQAPSLIIIDEIDALCSRRDAQSSGAESRIVTTLLTLIDGIGSDGKVFILATTNSPDSLDSALRRAGRFDFEIEIGVPSVDQRKQILESLLTSHDVSEEFLSRISALTHGFVGADLKLLVKEATLNSLKRSSEVRISGEDLMDALSHVKPSSIREIALEIPRVRWNQIGGQALTKELLREAIELPLKFPEKFFEFGIRPPKGVLLYGPPGCSKTLLAKALATESGLNFLAVKGPEIFSKWVGDSEKNIREIFRKARLSAPSIIFFDEFDAIAAKRSPDASGSSVTDRVVSQILVEMDGADPLLNVMIIAATNRPDIIDPALLRPGRFDRQIFVPLPDNDARKGIFSIQANRIPFGGDVSIEELTAGYSGAEVAAICQEAGLLSLASDIESVNVPMKYFREAIRSMSPRTSKEMINFFSEYASLHLQ